MRVRGLLVLPLLLSQNLPAETLDLREVCDPNTVTTLVAYDSDRGTGLFAFPSRWEGTPGWLLEVTPGQPVAHLYPDSERGRRKTSSIGPGRPFALLDCGPECAQPVRWENGRWSPFGQRVEVDEASTLHATYDGQGTPWFVELRPDERVGVHNATAFLLEGQRWRNAGTLAVRFVGSPALTAAPPPASGVRIGTGAFTPHAPPASWVRSWPRLEAGEVGQILAVDLETVVVATASSRLYTSEDRGKSWNEQLWTPWGTAGGQRNLWRRGVDYSVDLLQPPRGSDVLALWFDPRTNAEARVQVSRWSTDSGWRIAGTLTAENRSELPEHYLVNNRGEWTLLGRCRPDARGLWMDAWSAPSEERSRFNVQPGW